MQLSGSVPSTPASTPSSLGARAAEVVQIETLQRLVVQLQQQGTAWTSHLNVPVAEMGLPQELCGERDAFMRCLEELERVGLQQNILHVDLTGNAVNAPLDLNANLEERNRNIEVMSKRRDRMQKITTSIAAILKSKTAS